MALKPITLLSIEAFSANSKKKTWAKPAVGLPTFLKNINAKIIITR